MEAQTNRDVQMEALRVREKEAKLEYKVAWKEAQNDAIRAESSQTRANADMRKADAKFMKEESKAEERSAERESRGSTTQDYWYG